MRFSLLIIALLAEPGWAASGSMVRNDDLRASPSSSAAVVAHVSKGTSVEVLGRDSGWTQVKGAGKTGWVRILSVRTTSNGGSADLGGLIQAGTTKGDSSRAVAVAGVRGLSEEELKGAKYSPEQISLLDLYKVDKANAEQFAQSGGLTARQVAQLPAPQPDVKKDKGSSTGGGLNLLGE